MRKYLIYDEMTFGHGAKNMSALLSSRRFRQLVDDSDVAITLQITSILQERLSDVLGDVSEWGSGFEIGSSIDEGGHGLIGALRSCRNVLRVMRTGRYDTVLLMSGDKMLWFLPFIKLFGRVSNLAVLIFRPVVHYRECGYKEGRKIDREKFQSIPAVKNKMLLFYMKLGLVSRVAFQDEGAVDWFRNRGVDARWFPTPPAIAEFEVLPSEENNTKTVFTIFGALAARKGVYASLRAFEALSDPLKKRLQLRMIGKIREDKEGILSAVRRCVDSGVDVLLDERFVDQGEIKGIYKDADVMVLLYEGTLVAGSGVLIQALAFGRPVLATDVGWVGHTVSERKFGLTVDTGDIEAIGDAIQAFCDKKVDFDVHKMLKYAQQHEPENYGRAIVDLMVVQA